MFNKETAAKATHSPAEKAPTYPFPVDIFDAAEEVVLEADLPGVDREQLDVQFDRGTLTIRGRAAKPALEGAVSLEEYRVGNFERTFTVSEDIDVTGIVAELKNGVLSLRLPKSAQRKPRRIAVKAV